MTDQPYYVLNTDPNGPEVLHRNPREICNSDDMEGREVLDASTAEALMAGGTVRRCKHCNNPKAAP